MKKPSALVLTGYGINCDYETEFALGNAGFEPKRIHINDIISGREDLDDYHLLSFPGGFSYGDDLGAGKALANKIQNAKIADKKFNQLLQKFIDSGKLIIGICNGFQIMVKLGLLPAFGEKYFVQDVTLTFNDSGRFEDRWVNLKVNSASKCIFTRGIDKIDLPIRHGEGKFIVRDAITLQQLKENSQIVLQYADENCVPTMSYPQNPNGSIEGIAGICNASGRVFGLMPHPEAHTFFFNHPNWTRIREQHQRQGLKIPEEGAGLKVFKNAFGYAVENLV